MLQGTDKTNTLPSQFVLTQEQRIALIQGKVERAEAQVKRVAELARLLKPR